MTVSGAGEGVEQPLKSADAAFGATDGFEILPPANFLSLQETARLQGTLERSLEKLASHWLDPLEEQLKDGKEGDLAPIQPGEMPTVQPGRKLRFR